jgi:hypothetical protein
MTGSSPRIFIIVVRFSMTQGRGRSGVTTRRPGEPVISTTATDRDFFGLKIWGRCCCVIRGEGCHPTPPPDLRKGLL